MRISAPVIVVSNRLPFVLKRNAETNQLERKQSAGGLVTAVAPVVVQCHGKWIGWPGLHLEDPKEAIPESPEDCKAPAAGLKSSQVVPVTIDPQTFDEYYNGCCNGTFWPLFHSMPDRALFSADKWQAYAEVNSKFAEITIATVEEMFEKKEFSASNPPLIWIHDYHLMLMANTVRQALELRNITAKFGFFLHIPFPPWDIFRIFPWDDEVLQGLLGSDLVGFHIEDYCLNFIDCCQRRLGCRVDRDNLLVEFGGRTVSVRPLPIGIPFDRFVKMAQDAPKMVSNFDVQIILGVDRLDYTKGLVNRFKSFERLLEKYPDYIGKVLFLQVVVPSRTDVKEYAALKEEIDQLVGCINGRFSNPNWSPIRYIYGCIDQEELAAFYRDASVALVTPLRDGMNLVAKEYVACQGEKPGVLILSPFAGAGETMHEALKVNPYEIDDVADTLHEALSMPDDERELRMTYLRRRERIHNVTYWLHQFLQAMQIGAEDLTPVEALKLNNKMLPLSVDDFAGYLVPYLTDFSKLVLLLDYDGTLAPIALRPNMAFIPEETKRTLERLTRMNDVFITVISGRGLDNLRTMVGVEGITYAGNHGMEILHPDGTKFCHPVPEEYEDKVTGLLKSLQEECCHDGAWVENKGIILTYHYREAAPEMHRELRQAAREVIITHGFKPCEGHCSVEARPPVKWGKGRASLYILRTMLGVDWIERAKVIYAGDDTTDEDAMRSLKGMAFTFRVIDSKSIRTAASKRLPNTDAVLTMLKWIEKFMTTRTTEVTRKKSSSLSSPFLHSPLEHPSTLSPQEMASKLDSHLNGFSITPLDLNHK